MRNMPFRSDSVTSPSSSIFSSFTLISSSLRSDGHDVRRLGAFLALTGFVRHLCPLNEGLEPRAGDRAEVNKQVLAAVIRGDEAISLGVVEPLHGSGCHIAPPSRVHERVRKAGLHNQTNVPDQLHSSTGRLPARPGGRPPPGSSTAGTRPSS